jgi:formiminoglutamate deiminase
MSTLWCEYAWLGGPRPQAGVVLELSGDTIESVTAAVERQPQGAQRVGGLVIPGLANVHSHAFQRALRGRTHSTSGSFWTWREQMYDLALKLDPDSLHALARATFAEMALAGITLVGEFLYLHHGPGGVPYADPNALGQAVMRAAAEAGVRLTLLDACYLDAGEAAQRRFCDRDADAWRMRVERLRGGPMVRIGAAIHSVRAVDPDAAASVAAWAAAERAPLHAHVSEQPAENEACLEARGTTPTGLLARAGALSARFTAVHATHVSDQDVALLGDADARVCLCPTTERDLADGIAPARRLAAARLPLSLGSDSNAVIDLFEEARAVELDERLASGIRGQHTAHELLVSATANGYASLGWHDGGEIRAGARADLVAVSLESVRLAGTTRENMLDALVFAAAAPDVREVIVGGRLIVRDGMHETLNVPQELQSAIERVL